MDAVHILGKLLKAYPAHFEQFITGQLISMIEPEEKMIITSDELPKENDQQVVTLLRCITYSESAFQDR